MILLGTVDSKRNASPVYRYLILRALAPMVPDKENRERVLRDSGLDRTYWRDCRTLSIGWLKEIMVLGFYGGAYAIATGRGTATAGRAGVTWRRV